MMTELIKHALKYSPETVNNREIPLVLSVKNGRIASRLLSSDELAVNELKRRHNSIIESNISRYGKIVG